MRLLAVAVLVTLVAAARGSTLDAIIAREGPASGSFAAFQGFMAEFDRVYDSPTEMARRFAIFQENMENAAQQNVEEPTAEYGVTRFSDMTYEEFAAGFLTVFPDASAMHFDTRLLATPEQKSVSKLSAPPNAVDWRDQMNSIKDQKACGSCWAFSAMAAAEGTLIATDGNKVDGAEQHLVDCDKKSGGCNGGWMHWGLAVLSQDGLVDQAKYPYKARNQKCQYNSDDVVARVGAVNVACANSPYVEPEIQSDDCTDDDTRARVAVRPQSIAINANAMMSYRGGIADPKSCNPKQLNHGVDIVGYDEEDGVNYYIIRNSWGTRWGEKGFYRLVSDKNACGIQAYQVEVLPVA